MASFVMRIGSTDISQYIATDGFDWERNDIDADKSGRDMNGTMRRRRITSKDKISVKCRQLSGSELSTIVGLIAPATVSVTYLCPATATQLTRTFYGSSVKSATVQDIGNGNVVYDNVSFSLIEV